MERWASPGLAAQAAYLRYLGTAPVAQVFDRDGVYAVRTGIASNTENGVLSAGNVPDALVAETIEWVGHVPASWLCAEGSGRGTTAERLWLHAAGPTATRGRCAARSMTLSRPSRKGFRSLR